MKSRDIDDEWRVITERAQVVLALLSCDSTRTSAISVARLLGYSSSDALRKFLRSAALPPFELLRDWYLVVQLAELHANGTSIAKSTMWRGSYPSVYYRFVERVTGIPWSVVREKGVTWAKMRALDIWSPWLS